MWRRSIVLARGFSSNMKRDPEMQSRLLKYLGIYTAFLGAVYLSYNGYSRYKDPPQNKKQRISEIEKLALSHPAYAGVPREREADRVLGLMKESVVVIYNPTISGKTQFAEYLKSAITRPVLIITGKSTLEETLRQFSFLTPLRNSYTEGLNIGTFRDTLSDSLSALKDQQPLIIIDAAELMPDVLTQMLIMMCYRLKTIGVGDALVFTNSMKVLPLAKSCKHHSGGEMQIQVLADLDQGEFLKVATSLGVSLTDAKMMYDECGASLELLQEFRTSGFPLPDFITAKRKQFLTSIQELIRAKPHLVPELERAEQTINPHRHFGDIFAGSEVARVLTEKKLMVEYPNGSTRFRHKLAIDAVRQAVKRDQ